MKATVREYSRPNMVTGARTFEGFTRGMEFLSLPRMGESIVDTEGRRLRVYEPPEHICAQLAGLPVVVIKVEKIADLQDPPTEDR